MKLLHGCDEVVARLSQGCHKLVTRLQGLYNLATTLSFLYGYILDYKTGLIIEVVFVIRGSTVI